VLGILSTKKHDDDNDETKGKMARCAGQPDLNHAEVEFAGHVIPPLPVVVHHEKLVAAGVHDKLGHREAVPVRERVNNGRQLRHLGQVNFGREVEGVVVGESKRPATKGAPHVVHVLLQIEQIHHNRHNCNDTVVHSACCARYDVRLILLER
jgi:hypothetical protein